MRTHAEQRRILEDAGYVEVGSAPVLDGEVRPGSRVRNRCEEYPEAHRAGTAVVVAVYEKKPSSWSQRYGGRDVEVITQQDRHPQGVCPMLWPSYAVHVLDPARQV